MIKILTKWFKSIKLAAVLMFILSILCLIGIFLPQIPHEFSASTDGSTWWVENVAHGRFGDFAQILGFWGFFNVFRSIWFLGTVVLLLINISVCSLSRFNSLKSSFAKVKVKTDLDFYKNSKFCLNHKSKSSIESTYSTVSKILNKHHYNLIEAKDGNNIFISGEKNRYSVFGTYAIHLSLFVFILGILLGSFFGFQKEDFVVIESNKAEVGYGTNLSLSLISFVDEYWEDGTPKDYRSEAVLYENGKEVKKGWIRVNHPLSYKGVRFYQSFFGPAVKLKIEDSDGGIIFNDNVVLSRVSLEDSVQRPEGDFKLKEEYIVNVIGNTLDGVDTSIAEDEIGIELYDSNMVLVERKKLGDNVPQKLGNLTFTLMDKLQYSGFIVSKDPGNIFIWMGSLLFLIGIVIVFYFPNCQIWVALDSSPKNSTIILMKMNSVKKFTLENELESFVSELENNLDLIKEVTS